MSEICEKKKRASKVTEEQKQIMVDYIEKNKTMVMGKFTNNFTASDCRELWNNLGGILNACNGAKKTGQRWRKCWQDIKSLTKSKAAEVTKHQNGTGGGKKYADGLSCVQEKIRSLIPNCSVEGHVDVMEAQCNLSNIVTENTGKHRTAVSDTPSTLTAAVVSQAGTLEAPSAAGLLEVAMSPTVEDVSDSESVRNETLIFPLDDSVCAVESKPVTKRLIIGPTPTKRKRITATSARLHRATEATNQLAKIATEKLKAKEEYYKQKLEIS